MKRILRHAICLFCALFYLFAVIPVEASGTSTLTLYANWKTQITFDANGGVLAGGATDAERALAGRSSGSLQLSVGQSLSTGLTGVHDGYIFTRWNTQSNGTGQDLSEFTTVTGPLTFYAVYYKSDFDAYGSYPSGSLQTFSAPYTGWYQIQCWGASGQDAQAIGTSYYAYGGKGGYAAGRIHLNVGQVLYVNCGYGGGVDTVNWINGNVNHVEGYGGGAADVRMNTSLYSRICAAGGGGAGAIYAGGNNPEGSNMGTATGGAGGGLIGGNGYKLWNNMTWDAPVCTGGTQTEGGRGYSSGEHSGHNCNGQFGYRSNECVYGGDGWYGGGGNRTRSQMSSGGGGSGYAAGFPGCAVSSTGVTLTNPQLLSGADLITEPNGSSAVGHTGNAHVRIVCVSRD